MTKCQAGFATDVRPHHVGVCLFLESMPDAIAQYSSYHTTLHNCCGASEPLASERSSSSNLCSRGNLSQTFATHCIVVVRSMRCAVHCSEQNFNSGSSFTGGFQRELYLYCM